MTAQPQVQIKPIDYLVMERASDQQHEYYDGHIVALASGMVVKYCESDGSSD